MALGRGFARLWAGNALGNLSDGLAFVVIPLLAVALTTDPLLVAGLPAAYSAVRLLTVVPVGVLVDRWDRRAILWRTNLLRGGLLLGLAAALSVGVESITALYAVYVALGVLESAADNAALSVLPSLVPDAQLDRANGRISAVQLIADEFVGPPLGGVLFGMVMALPVYVMGGLHLGAAAFFLALPRSGPVQRGGQPADGGDGVAAPRDSLIAEAVEGARWLRRHRLLGGLAAVGAVANLAYIVPFSVLVLWAREDLGLGAAGYGVFLAVSALGGLVGSFVAAPVRERMGYGPTIFGALLLGSATMAGLWLTTSPWWAGGLLAAYILHAVVWGICVAALRQRLVPDRLRGRVNGSARLLAMVGLTVGALLGGVIASMWGLAVTFLVSGVLFAGCAAVIPWVFRGEGAPERVR